MQDGPFEGFRVARFVAVPFEQRDAELLVRHFLRMLEGQVEEWAEDRFDLSVEALVQGAARDRPRQPVGRVGMAAATEEITRELVEEKQQGEGALGRRLPIGEIAAGGLHV